MWLNKNKWFNELWCGDNKEVLKNIPDESVDLIYIDPPFFSNRHYEVIWGNGAELRSFGDRWKGGIKNYGEWMEDRLKELHRILKPSGTLYIHLDWHAVHYLKVALDIIFRPENFLTEIIWNYGTPSGGRLAGSKPIKGHDTLLVYVKEYGRHKFNKIFLPYSDKYIKDWFRYVDVYGRRYRKRWRRDKNGKSIVEKQYLDESKGMPVSTVWSDIQQLYADPRAYKASQRGKSELIGYPTQKPESLLERIIKLSSDEGDVVLDAFCGCGTTIAVAEKLKRKWIGIDVSPIAVMVMTERLIKLEEKLGRSLADFIPLGSEKTVEFIKKLDGYDFQDFIIKVINGKAAKRKSGDFGIDGYTSDNIPVQITKTEPLGIDKMFKFESALKFDSKERGIKDKVIKGKIYAFSFSKKAWEERARAIKEENIEIEFVEIEKRLAEKYGAHFWQEEKKEAKKRKRKKIRLENLKITVIALPKKQKV